MYNVARAIAKNTMLYNIGAFSFAP